MSVFVPKDEYFPEGCREIIATALPIYRSEEKYDFAKRLMDAATIIGALRRGGFKLVKVEK